MKTAFRSGGQIDPRFAPAWIGQALDTHVVPKRLAEAAGNRFAMGLVLYDHTKPVPFGRAPMGGSAVLPGGQPSGKSARVSGMMCFVSTSA